MSHGSHEEKVIDKEVDVIRGEINMRRRVTEVFLVVAVMTFAAGFSAFAAQEEAGPVTKMGGDTASAIAASAPQPGWYQRACRWQKPAMDSRSHPAYLRVFAAKS